MKHNKKGQQPQAKRSRAAGKEAAVKGVQPVAEAPGTVSPKSLADDSSPEVRALSSVAPATSNLVVSDDVAAAAVESAVPKADKLSSPVPLESPAPTLAPAAAPVVLAPPAASAVEDLKTSAALTVAADGGAATGPTAIATVPLPKRAGAEQIVRDYLPLAVGAGLIPVPGVDLAAIGGLQLKVLASLAAHYKVAFTRAQAQLIVTSLLGSVGTTVLVGSMLMSLAKAIPVFGPLLGVSSLPVAGGAITHAVGQLAIDHFEAGGTMENFDLDVAQRAFARKVAEAKVALA
jgi:uncharacterized protein (DUF697 family)